MRIERIGGATLYLGDALEILPRLEAADVVLTDPPFGVREDDWDAMDAHEFARFSMAWIAQAVRLSEELLAFGFMSNAVHRLCEMAYPVVRPMIWHKPIGSELRSSADRRFFAFECIFHCRKTEHPASDSGERVSRMIRTAREAAGLNRGAVDIRVRGKKTGLCYRWEEGACLPTPEQVRVLHRIMPLGEDFDEAVAAAYDGRADHAEATNVLTYRTVTAGRHPCEKPVDLLKDLIRTTGPHWRTVVDPFMGVGSTGVAAVAMGREFVGIEQDPAYFAVACERIEAAQRQADLFVEAPVLPLPAVQPCLLEALAAE